MEATARPLPQRQRRLPLARPRWARDGVFLVTLLAVLALDQVSKAVIQAVLPEGASVVLTPFLRLTHITNTGSAFGLFQGYTLFLIVASVVGLVVLILFYRQNRNAHPLVRLCIGLMVGGALGNLIDRVRLGYVVDFVDLGWWPVFNLADSAIVVGISGLVVAFLAAQSRGHRRVVVRPLPPQRFRRPPSEVGC
ncbi:MAG: signal peptidase II [Chloroflexota bacterium]|nr:signal peptidase II [Chloroflexota bacterium]